MMKYLSNIYALIQQTHRSRHAAKGFSLMVGRSESTTCLAISGLLPSMRQYLEPI